MKTQSFQPVCIIILGLLVSGCTLLGAEYKSTSTEVQSNNGLSDRIKSLESRIDRLERKIDSLDERIKR
jgi:outer membrane murein-binding lipoprotein Lpp